MSTYYSPFAILTDSQKAPCVFELAAPLLAPLNSGNPVEQGTRVDLPLWLASILTSSEPAGPGNGYICLIELPASMGKKVVNALRADPKSVELRQQAAFWFGMSEHMMILLEDEAVQEVIIDSFKQRALEIADKAQNSRSVQHGSGGDEFMNGLDQTERQLFRAAHDGSKAVKNWFDVASHRT
ncbi:putative GINS complex, subunit Psf3, GINS subunit, domain A, GINS complex, subunit Psf3 superfamily [Septoria linicola]|nr:putative GINS complex, subunit Psf3, GINS subunit, domain A, GINS complex, subunit Psf3 superfamily [Septoria linicola]